MLRINIDHLSSTSIFVYLIVKEGRKYASKQASKEGSMKGSMQGSNNKREEAWK